MPGALALELHIAAKLFGRERRTVLHDVRFAAAPGEIIALLGASGAGKSTTLRIALGLDTDFSGRVIRRCLRPGVVFQEPRLLPWLDVADNIRLVCRGEPDIAALLALVGLPDAGARMPRALSLGMARRVALARALAAAPDLLVLDEPFASLDPGLSAALAASVAAWARAHGATVLMATHDLPQALAVADRVLVLAGTPATLAADTPISAGAAALRAAFGFLDGHAPT